jgi:hypothetical protein
VESEVKKMAKKVPPQFGKKGAVVPPAKGGKVPPKKKGK